MKNDIPADEVPKTRLKEYKKPSDKKTIPREWSKDEEDFVFEKRQQGYSRKYLAELLNRSEVSIGLKYKRLKKQKGLYNDDHIENKEKANQEFIDLFSNSNITLLDLYAGTESFWKNKKRVHATTNDINPKAKTDYNLDALKLISKLYFEDKTFSIIDLDPYGSAYDCFDLAIKMAEKGLIITYGELGHLRFKRLDFVKLRYPRIKTLDDFTPENLIKDTQDIARRNKKEITPEIIEHYKYVTRVYYSIKKITGYKGYQEE